MDCHRVVKEECVVWYMYLATLGDHRRQRSEEHKAHSYFLHHRGGIDKTVAIRNIRQVKKRALHVSQLTARQKVPDVTAAFLNRWAQSN